MAVSKPFAGEIRLLSDYLSVPERKDSVSRVLRRRPVVALRHWVSSWLLVGLGVWAAMRSPWLTPAALVLIASRQRALGNLLHDAAHRNLAGLDRVTWIGADWACWMLAAPLFEDYGQYRRAHLRHHSHLGRPSSDPDLVVLPLGEGQRPPSRVYFSCLMSGRRWLSNVIGELGNLDFSQRGNVVLWWVLVLLSLSLIFGWTPLAWFSGLWMLSRMTVFHGLKTFTELCDHVGLKPGTVLGFSRNAPDNILAVIVHPLHDGYHLTHHLMPRVPMANLPEAHRLLKDYPGYSAAEHCDAYFVGRRTVWTGIARNPAPVEDTDLTPSTRTRVSLG